MVDLLGLLCDELLGWVRSFWWRGVWGYYVVGDSGNSVVIRVIRVWRWWRWWGLWFDFDVRWWGLWFDFDVRLDGDVLRVECYFEYELLSYRVVCLCDPGSLDDVEGWVGKCVRGLYG